MFTKSYTGLLFFILITDSIIGSCMSFAMKRKTAKQSSLEPKDIDDFVPYEGKRFDSFDWNLWKAVAANHSSNVLISPLSIKLALVLLYEGAQNETANELAMAMNFPANRSATRNLFLTILKGLKEHPDYILKAGTRVYIDSSISTRQRYCATLKTFYETDLRNVNFSHTHTISNEINNWATNITHGNIKKMITNENKLKNSAILITSALFFKGTWENHLFSKDTTRSGKFIISLNESVNVDYMNAVDRFYFHESSELNAKILRLPYKGQKYSMYLILPIKLNGLNQLIAKINPHVLNRIIWHMEEVDVDVKIPKFKFDTTSHLEPNLRQLGIQDIFSDKATLNGIAHTEGSTKSLFVSDIIHKAGIDVNEDGTSAYATTAIHIGNKNSDQSFYAEYPFMFYIEDESTGTILYIGKVSNPLEINGNLNEMPPITELPSRFGDGMNVSADVLGMGLEDRYNYFNLELVQKLYEEQEGNVIVSPASVKAALMTLIEGTDGRTQQEILSSLRLPTNLSIIRNVANRNLASFKNKSNQLELDLAIRFWASKDIQILEAYKDILQKYYESDVSSVDFKMIDNAACMINDWVQQKTHNHIKSIVNYGNLDPETKLLITSAIYFKSQWQNSFIHNRTKLDCFKTFENDCQMTPMMENLDMYQYANVLALEAQILEIPYSGQRFSLLVVLPNKPGKEFLDTLSRDLSYTPIPLLLENLRKTEIELQMPKFNIENKFNLKDTLEKLGIKDLFNSNANISKAILDTQFYVSDVVQNAKIEVNENGTEASAITGLTIVPLMASSAVSFRVNRPFLFFIIDLSSNSILFAGRLIQP